MASKRGRPSLVQLLGELDDQDRVLAGQPDQHHQADLHEDVDVALCVYSTPATEQSRHIGTTRITASGSDQLSYSAASARKTQTTASAKTYIAVLPARICMNISSVHSVVHRQRQGLVGQLVDRRDGLARS